MRVPLFRERHGFRHPPEHGELLGKRVLALVAPTDCDARSVIDLERALHPYGVRLGVTSETHGEAQGERSGGRPPALLDPDCLLVEARPEDWDAVIVAGGTGAERVEEDAFARDKLRSFAAAGRPIYALGEGEAVLRAAKLEGRALTDTHELARALIEQLEPTTA